MIKEHDVFAVLRKAAPYGQHTATSFPEYTDPYAC